MSRLRTAGILVAILVLAAGLRWAAAYRGLPYLYHWDEPTIANIALTMLKTGDFNPYDFRYPSLLIYLTLIVDVAHYFYLVGLPVDAPATLDGLASLTAGEPGFMWTTSHPSFYLWDRWLVGVFGVATILGVWLLGRRGCSGVVAGAAGALFLAILPFHISQSAYLTTDVPAACLGVFVLVFAWRYLDHGRSGDLVAAALLTGLATSTKYNLGMLAVLVGLALLSRAVGAAGAAQRPPLWLWPTLPAIALAGFFVATPYALLDLPRFLDGAGSEIRHYLVLGHRGAEIEAGWPHLRFQVSELVANMGWIPLVIATLGLGWLALRRTGGWLLLFVAALQLILVARTVVSFHRNLMLIYPLLAVGIGVAAQLVVARLSTLEWRRLPWPAIAHGSVAMLLVLPLPGVVRAAADTLGDRDSRSLAIDEVNRLAAGAPDGTEGVEQVERVWIASELRVHRLDLERLAVPYRVAQMLEIGCRRPQGIAVIAPLDPQSYVAVRRRLAEVLEQLLLASAPPSWVSGSQTSWIDIYPVQPRLGIWSDRGFQEESGVDCGIFGDLGLFAGPGGEVVAADGFVLSPGGRVATAAKSAWDGNYEVHLRARGAVSPGAIAGAVLGAEVVREGTVIARVELELDDTRQHYHFGFRLDDPATVALRFDAVDSKRPRAETLVVSDVHVRGR